MSKAVLMSIQPKWCELIACGKKTIEIRKTKPKLDVPFKVYIYCTRYEKGKLIWRQGNKFLGYKLTDVSGKIIGEFVCDTVFPISISYSDPNNRMALREFPFTGLSDKDIMDYLGNGKEGYGWYIQNLIIYDKPKELSEFCKPIECHRGIQKEECNGCWDCEITRPPQSWCYVEELEDI